MLPLGQSLSQPLPSSWALREGIKNPFSCFLNIETAISNTTSEQLQCKEAYRVKYLFSYTVYIVGCMLITMQLKTLSNIFV